MSGERVLDAETVSKLLQAAADRSAVVLERLPRGGGDTRWFHCATPAALRTVLDVLRPASRVSVYFDGRIAEHELDDQFYEAADLLLSENREIVLGTMPVDGIEIAVDFPSSRREVDECLGLVSSPIRTFVGAFPAPDDDGTDAFTVLVPDDDGSVRHEPH